MGWTEADTFVFEEDFTLLSEGLAERTCFQKLMEAGKIARFDCPWPVDNEDKASEEQKKMASLSGFVHMLRMFNRMRGLRPVETSKCKGILIVADARNDRSDTFARIKRQIIEATVPNAEREVARSPDGHPAIAVLLIPLEGKGSLETLCLEQLVARHPKVGECLDGYMACEAVASSIKEWTTERKEKARLQSLVAVTNKEDPNKTIRRLFSTTETTEARINVTDACFLPIWKAVANFCAEVTT